MADLPERTEEAEDALVQEWRASDDSEGLIALISTAIDARRPRLAARLVGLLGDHVEIEPGSALARAQQAARLFLLDKNTPEDNSWSDLEDAWTEARRGRLFRMKLRQRRRMEGDSRRIGRLTRRKR